MLVDATGCSHPGAEAGALLGPHTIVWSPFTSLAIGTVVTLFHVRWLIVICFMVVDATGCSHPGAEAGDTHHCMEPLHITCHWHRRDTVPCKVVNCDMLYGGRWHWLRWCIAEATYHCNAACHWHRFDTVLCKDIRWFTVLPLCWLVHCWLHYTIVCSSSHHLPLALP